MAVGIERRVNLSLEESNELAIELLKQYWFAQVRALSDSAGSEATVEAMAPYFRNAAIAGTMLTKRTLGIEGEGFDLVADIWGFQNLNFGFDHLIAIREDGVTFEHSSPCPLFQAPKEVCIIYCLVGGRASCESLDLGVAYDLKAPDLDRGPNCRAVGGYMHRKGSGPPQGKVLRRVSQHVLREKYPIGLRQDFAIQYYGEFIVLTISAALDAMGHKAFAEVMPPALFEHGKAVGAALLRERSHVSDLRPLEAIDLVNRILKQSGAFQRKTEGIWAKEISDCPFSHAPKEFCSAFQGYLDGICNAFSEGSSFAYLRCMTAGERSCLGELKVHTVRRTESHGYQDHLAVLKMRLAKGEIGEEEYLRLKMLILEDR